MGWMDADTEYFLSNLSQWRSGSFREQENLIAAMIKERHLSFDEDEIRLRMGYLDQLTNGDFSPYELMTIPAQDKHLIGTCKKTDN